MQRYSPNRFLMYGALLFAWLAVELAFAGTGTVASLPLAGKKATSGLKLEVDSRWIDGCGYRPVRLKLSQTNGAVAKITRTVKVRLRPYHWQNRSREASAWIELPQGETFGEATIPVPQDSMWWSIHVETKEDGRLIPELCDDLGVQTFGGYDWTEALPSILIVDIDAHPNPNVRPGTKGTLPDVRTLLSHFYHRDSSSGNTLDPAEFKTKTATDDDDLLDLVFKMPRALFLPPSALPTSWVQLSAVDFMLISMDDLEELRQDKQRWEAVRRWISAGAVLCVYGVGDRFERLAQLEALTELAPLTDHASSELRGWNEPDPAGYHGVIDAFEFAQFGPEDTSDQSATSPQRPYPFVWRSAETGRIIALRNGDPFPGDRADWAWIFNSFPDSQWMWFSRFGMSMNRENDDYWNMMVPGVGAAPVNSFLILITLFVIAVGPIVYVFLRRWHRLQLLLFVVPTSAAVVTTTLFLYALFDDGLSVRARARTVTTLDQRSGRVATWGRHAYYAGLAPSAGLIYPSNAIVHPMDHKPSRTGGPGRHTFWLDEQHLDTGYLRSRTMAQLMVVQAGKTKAGLEVLPPDKDGHLSVKNQLGVRVRRLVVRDDSGQLHFAADISPSSSSQLDAKNEKEFQSEWLAAIDEFAPEFPTGFSPRDMDNASSIFGNSWSYLRVDTSLQQPQARTSVLERAITEARSWDELPPRSYLAIVARAPDLELGAASAGEEASFHLVRGSW